MRSWVIGLELFTMLTNYGRVAALLAPTRSQPSRRMTKFWGGPLTSQDNSAVDLDALSGGTVRTVTEHDRRVIEERQLRHKADALIGVPSVSKCQHGFPQVGLSSPIGHDTTTGWKPVSGICRLTCPYLVKALDEYEAEGAVAAYNIRLTGGEETFEGRTWPAALDGANQAHRKLRRALMSDEEVARVRERLGSEHEDAFMQSGVAGMSPTKLNDVKCLHAQLGDYLLRNDNVVGEAIVKDLEQRGVSLGGNDVCRQQCDVSVPEVEGGWSYVSTKNHSKLRTKVQRRPSSEARKKIPSKRPPRVKGSSAANTESSLSAESQEKPLS